MNRKALFTLILGTVLAVAPAAQRGVLPDGGSGGGFGTPGVVLDLQARTQTEPGRVPGAA